jgi:superfamily II DNA/RNA helicase
VAALEQYYMMMPSQVKECYLIYLLRKMPESSTIVFTSTCRSCATIQLMLRDLGIPAVALHSQLSQQERIGALASFKSRYVQVLVATDVASRGLDIPWVEVVINFDIPTAPTDYIHRVGRTARAGKSGLALTLVTQYDVDLVHTIEATMGMRYADVSLSQSKQASNYNN